MTTFHDVALEFVRPGPAHNQLLSPLTMYMALCGDSEPITFRIEMEHRQLLNRLEHLRYATQGARVEGVPEPLRQAEVVNLGHDMGLILSKIHSLNSELSRAGESEPAIRQGDDQLVHLRLVLSGSELSLLPFEMAVAPQAFPGEGREFVLQGNKPIVVTREIRRSRPWPVAWNRPVEPRVLFISASPAGMTVPKAAHVHALRSALTPWIPWAKTRDERLKDVKTRLRVLPNASIEEIYETCAKETFTHVHILAHGDYYEEAGERRFGVALCRHGNRFEKEVIGGRRLAKALLAGGGDGTGRSKPVMVVLATCDSGHPGSVLVPGGSIAYELHTAGIPWVLASQFPLTISGSVRMAEALYPRLLRGDDPREILYEIRRHLFVSADRDHDWASLVAYTATPPDFAEQVTSFFERQMRRAIEVAFKCLDDDNSTDEAKGEAQRSIEQHLGTWKERLPNGDTTRERQRRAECYGMHGSAMKRIALLRFKNARPDKGQEAEKQLRLATEKLRESRGWYQRAMDDLMKDLKLDHWTATQYLSLTAVLNEAFDQSTYSWTLRAARQDLSNADPEKAAWAHGSVAELEMLGVYHAGADRAVVLDRVKTHCDAIVQRMGADSFPAASTRRQFRRYLDYWKSEKWHDIAAAAVKALTPAETRLVSELPPYA